MSGANRYQYGIIGGMGFNSTNFFLQRLYERFPAECDQEFPPLIVHYATFMPDRTEALFDSEQEAEIFDRIRAEIEDIRDRVDAYVFLCNTIHHFVRKTPYRDDERRIDLINMTIRHIESQPSAAPCVLLATRGTYAAGLYESGAITTPETEIREAVHDAIYRYKRKQTQDATTRLAGILEQLPGRTILAGCTEISEMLALLGKPERELICPVTLLAEHMTSQAKSGAAW